jgi:hypothetical protein
VRALAGTAERPGTPNAISAADSTERSDTAVTVTIPLVAIVAILVYIAYRYMGLRMWHAIVAVILGFLLAATNAAPAIQNLLTSLTRWLNKP